MRALALEHDLFPLMDKHRCAPSETRDHMFLRFLRARKFKVTKAWELLEADLKWREDTDIQALARKTPAEILGVEDLGPVVTRMPWWHQGFDKEGRPVVWKTFGNCDVAKVLEHTTLDGLLNLHLWQQEYSLRQCALQGARTGHAVETIVAVFDATDWAMKLATRTAYSFLKGMADLDNVHYPERLGAIVVINAPYMLAFVWKIVSTWLDERTKQKIFIKRGKDDYLPVLKQLMDDDQIPQEFGGTGLIRAPVDMLQLRFPESEALKDENRPNLRVYEPYGDSKAAAADASADASADAGAEGGVPATIPEEPEGGPDAHDADQDGRVVVSGPVATGTVLTAAVSPSSSAGAARRTLRAGTVSGPASSSSSLSASSSYSSTQQGLVAIASSPSSSSVGGGYSAGNGSPRMQQGFLPRAASLSVSTGSAHVQQQQQPLSSLRLRQPHPAPLLTRAPSAEDSTERPALASPTMRDASFLRLSEADKELLAQRVRASAQAAARDAAALLRLRGDVTVEYTDGDDGDDVESGSGSDWGLSDADDDDNHLGSGKAGQRPRGDAAKKTAAAANAAAARCGASAGSRSAGAAAGSGRATLPALLLLSLAATACLALSAFAASAPLAPLVPVAGASISAGVTVTVREAAHALAVALTSTPLFAAAHALALPALAAANATLLALFLSGRLALSDGSGTKSKSSGKSPRSARPPQPPQPSAAGTVGAEWDRQVGSSGTAVDGKALKMYLQRLDMM